MAAPPTASMQSMSGSWTFCKALSDSTDALLRLQGLPWWKRQAAGVVTVTERISHKDTHVDIVQFITGGFKGGEENLVLDGSTQPIAHPNLGPITTHAMYSDLTDVDEGWLKEGWCYDGEGDSNQKRHIKVVATSDNNGWTLTVIWGFVVHEGERWFARKLLCAKNGETAKCRAFYGWVAK